MKIQRAAEKSDGFELNMTQTEIIVLIVPCVFRKMKKKALFTRSILFEKYITEMTCIHLNTLLYSGMRIPHYLMHHLC
jgi:hypothetical protein